MTSNSGSIGILNSSGNKGDPCLTPRVIPFSLRQPGTSCKDHPRNAQPSNVTQSCRPSSLLSWLVISLSKKSSSVLYSTAKHVLYQLPWTLPRAVGPSWLSSNDIELCWSYKFCREKFFKRYYIFHMYVIYFILSFVAYVWIGHYHMLIIATVAGSRNSSGWIQRVIYYTYLTFFVKSTHCLGGILPTSV